MLHTINLHKRVLQLATMREDVVPKAHVISPELRELRDLLRMRLRLVEKRTSTRNSIAWLPEKDNRTAVDALPALAQVQAGFHQEQMAAPPGPIRAGHFTKPVHRPCGAASYCVGHGAPASAQALNASRNSR